MKNNLTPDIRFSGFSGEWELRRLGDYAEILTGGTPKTQIKEYWEPREIPWMSSGEVNKKRLSSTESMISTLGFKNSSARWVKENSVLIALAGQGKTRGTVAINEIPLTTNQSIAAIVPEKELYCEFILPNLEKRYDELRSISSGDGTRGGLNKQLVSNVVIVSPTIEEQAKIGKFFKQIDETIVLQEQELTNLKQTKQGFLQKMFPKEGESLPEVRFPGFNEDWKEKKLIEVAKYRNGKAHEKNISDNGKYIVINSKFVSTDGKIKKYSDEQIEPMYKNEIAFVLSDVPNGRAIAKTYLVKSNDTYSLNQRIAGITPDKNTDAYFLYILMNRHQYFLRFDDGVGQTNLSKKDIEGFFDKYPSLEEQQKIGVFFKKLDDIIVLHQRELDILKETKKAFLQKMFV
jgi:type I restriction enzyme, S subunit